MGYRDALKQLNAGEVLGLMPPSVKSHYSASGPKVHHARFAASCTYDNDRVLRFYFSDVPGLKPRTADDLKHIGRKVLTALLDPQDSVDQKRIAVLNSDEKWAEMDANPAQILAPFYSDWTLITWCGFRHRGCRACPRGYDPLCKNSCGGSCFGQDLYGKARCSGACARCSHARNQGRF
jgi:hypothetical protein